MMGLVKSAEELREVSPEGVLLLLQLKEFDFDGSQEEGNVIERWIQYYIQS